jgi:hypothetical protein
VNIELSPQAIVDGEELTVLVSRPPGADAVQTVLLGCVDDVETRWCGELSVRQCGPDSQEGQISLDLGCESVVFATSVRLADGSIVEVTSNEVSANAKTAAASPEEVSVLRARLEQGQTERYEQPIGDPTATGAVEHSVVCVIERLLVTTALRTPGVQILPVNARPDGNDQLSLLNGVLASLGWAPGMPAQAWAQQVEPNRPWTVIFCPQVFAQGIPQAIDLAWERRDRLIAALGLSRSARGRPVATVAMQRQPDDSARFKCIVEDERYAGNLIGGPISGEDQRGLLRTVAALGADPLLALLVDLYGEALLDRSADGRYLRFWSILETLSGARVSSGQAVVLLDGLPYPSGNTSHAAPRVYQLIADRLRVGIDEASVVSPAANLYQAVRAWYARRNATGHYGRLDPTDPRQAQQGWMQWATMTIAQPGQPDTWLMALQRIVELVLHGELAAAGGITAP